MRYKINHPTDPQITAAYGWDHAIGFFVMVYRGGQIIEDYDVMAEEYEPLNGVLHVMIRHEFFDICDVLNAFYDQANALPEDLEPDLRLVGEVISNLQAAAD